MHGARAYAPFPAVYGHGLVAAAIDQELHERAGVIAEVAFAWWDTSPIDLTVLGRVDPIEGLRLRTGMVLPIGTWAGLAPMSEPSVREATWLLDVRYAL